jgi:hypothetical protein
MPKLTSAVGQKQTSAGYVGTSALPPNADNAEHARRISALCHNQPCNRSKLLGAVWPLALPQHILSWIGVPAHGTRSTVRSHASPQCASGTNGRHVPHARRPFFCACYPGPRRVAANPSHASRSPTAAAIQLAQIGIVIPFSVISHPIAARASCSTPINAKTAAANRA